MISFDAGASRFSGKNRVRSDSNVNFFATLRWSSAYRWSEGAGHRKELSLCDFGCVREAHARTGEIVDGRAAASADTSHYSWPS